MRRVPDLGEVLGESLEALAGLVGEQGTIRLQRSQAGVPIGLQADGDRAVERIHGVVALSGQIGLEVQLPQAFLACGGGLRGVRADFFLHGERDRNVVVADRGDDRAQRLADPGAARRQSLGSAEVVVEYLRSFGLFGLWQLWQSSGPGGRVQFMIAEKSSDVYKRLRSDKTCG